MDGQAASHSVNAQSVAEASTLSWVVAVVCYLSGVVFFQYGNFCQQVRRNKSASFGLGTTIITTHTVQVCIELWTTWRALIDAFLSGLQFSFYLDQSLEVWFTAVIVLLVQYHFCRITYTMAESKMWLIITGALSVANFIAAIGAGALFAREYRKVGSHVSAPLVPNATSLVFYVGWLALSCLSDVAISLKLSIALYRSRSSARHRSFKSLLGRLLTVTINTFSITALAACCSLICFTLPLVVPITLTNQLKLQITGFVINRALPRVYIISFFMSFGLVGDSQSKSFDLQVASLEFRGSRTSLDLKPIGGENDLCAKSSCSPNCHVHNLEIKLTQNVEVVVEESRESVGCQA